VRFRLFNFWPNKLTRSALHRKSCNLSKIVAFHSKTYLNFVLMIKSIFAILLLLIFNYYSTGQTYQLTVVNGYGDGLFEAGEEVHIFANDNGISQNFENWTGDVAFEFENEWHTKFIMPAQAVTVTANFRAIPLFSFNFENIELASSSKRVYYYLPETVRGVIFLFHDVGGNAQDWLFRKEYNRFLYDAVVDSFGVVFTEAQIVNPFSSAIERGGEAWDLSNSSPDENVDLANIRALRDTLISRGVMEANPKLYAVGMGTGGEFSLLVSNVLNFRAVVPYCAKGNSEILDETQVFTQWCMAANDESDLVGENGNDEAASFSQELENRTVCTRYLENEASPFYAGRLLSDPSITIELVNQIFEDLQGQSLIENNYLTSSGKSIAELAQQQPQNFQSLAELTDNQLTFVFDQMDVAFAAHQFYSDFNRQTLAFFKSFCGTDTIFPNNIMKFEEAFSFHIFPNPAQQLIHISLNDEVIHQVLETTIVDISGRIVYRYNGFKPTIELTGLQSGVYFMRLDLVNKHKISKFIKN